MTMRRYRYRVYYRSEADHRADSLRVGRKGKDPTEALHAFLSDVVRRLSDSTSRVTSAGVPLGSSTVDVVVITAADMARVYSIVSAASNENGLVAELRSVSTTVD